MRKLNRDQNEPLIISVLESYGCLVERLSPVATGGVPDLLCGLNGALFLCEVKNPALPANKRKLKGEQAEWHKRWAGYPVFVVETPADVHELIQSLRS